MASSDWLQFVSEASDGCPSPAPSSRASSKLADRPLAISEKICTYFPPPAPPSPGIPTPPASAASSPTVEAEDATVVSVSTTFYPSANLLSSPADLVFVSSDSVFFYVHMSQILRESCNSFKSLVPDPQSLSEADKSGVGPIVPLPDPAPVLNIVLHTIYNMSFVHYSPASSTLVSAVDALYKYGVSLRKHLTPHTLLYQYLLAQAPSSPFEFYATAGHYDLYELAVAVSPYTLARPLSDLTDELSDRMGPTYLKRIFFLHLGRVDALKRLLLPPPEEHSPSSDCDLIEQKKLTRAWALASAYLAWDVRPDLSTTAIELALLPLGDHITCDACKHAFRERVKQLLIQWALVKRTI